ERHRLDGADEVAGMGRQDALLAGDQRDRAGALEAADLVVVLARQEAQREADHAGTMAQHALDREMRLAGIGRAEDGGDAPLQRKTHDSTIGWDATDCKRPGPANSLDAPAAMTHMCAVRPPGRRPFPGWSENG